MPASEERKPQDPAAAPGPAVELWLWRHPRAQGAEGRCIGRTDLAVDRRRAKRLAHRIRRAARRNDLPREVWTSPRRRCRDVGRWLRRWGWVLYVDESLTEMDFGAWDGARWSTIGADAFVEWEADFLHHRVGGGESLAQLLERVRGFAASTAQPVRLVVGHGGWINAARWCGEAAGRPDAVPDAGRWPAAPRHASLTKLRLQGHDAR